MGNRHYVYKVEDRSYFAIIKKEIHALAVTAGFGQRRLAEVDIVVAEIVSNLVKHGGGGELLVKTLEDEGTKGIELISIDSGPGMTDPGKMLADGVSTRNTLGHGLGAMKRLSDLFQIYSQPGWGTIVLSRLFEKERGYKKPALAEIRSVVVPKPGETACGDGFWYKQTTEHLKIFLGDGLGHGEPAAAAVAQAGNYFMQSHETDPVEIIREMNQAVRKSRGLVGAVAIYSRKERQWSICGVGNIATRITGPSFGKSYMAYNGIIGLNVPRTLNTQTIVHEKGQQLILCSDGIRSRWDLTKLTGILRCDLSILTAAIYKDFGRHSDDMSVAVCKIN
ncbi:ATP-binding SpoIIE family protein phosphatase [Flavihumibacter petaseus]|uniref:Putative phosphoserine phosphatase n=1 Tax=Flavihumibacter petaseus NBRC 106054 TaxID=1220578 RepID=A0A0E9N629_9BACT|nr:ATP-binding SpoIIE family protein phosphatase [Flavihumibacter petaseus]GAO45161.1 putative phosphoserine phosphatase [Flavihumibacter petaseus NBRC 106054]